jgi:hypothetical protein
MEDSVDHFYVISPSKSEDYWIVDSLNPSIIHSYAVIVWYPVAPLGKGGLISVVWVFPVLSVARTTIL